MEKAWDPQSSQLTDRVEWRPTELHCHCPAHSSRCLPGGTYTTSLWRTQLSLNRVEYLYKEGAESKFEKLVSGI